MPDNKQTKKIFLNRAGASLLLAMLIMASILTISLATSRLVVSEIRQSNQLDKSMVAFYAAEAGLEKGLFQSRQKEFSAANFNKITNILDNEASYQLVASDTENVLYTIIEKDDNYQVDLFNPNSLTSLETPIRSVRIDWQGSGSWLDISWSAWTTSGSIIDHESLYVSQVSAPYIFNLSDSGTYLYRLRIIARNATASNVAITAYSQVDPVSNCSPLSSCQVSLPARVSIKSLGEYPSGSSQAARQAMLITMPQKSPLSGLYDYVLYSEEEIKKEN